MTRQQISDILHYTLFYAFLACWVILSGSFLFIDRNLEDLGRRAGDAAIILLWVVSLPGILKRFQVKGFLQQVQIVLMRSRRRIGILMFTLAMMHATWLRLFLYIKLRYIPPLSDFQTFELFGMAALALLTPLFITSNSFSVRTLKKNWNRIHYLIYVVMWTIAFHVAMQGKLQWAIPTFTIAILQLLSRVNEWKLKRNAPQL